MGKQNEDTLVFLDFGEVSDATGVGVPAGQKVYVWMFEGKDGKGNSWYLAFGYDSFNLAGVGERWPMYYSFKDPRVAGNSMRRLLLQGGTTRE